WRLEERPTLGRLHRLALDRYWGIYFLRRGRVSADLGKYSDARGFYFQSICHDPLRLRAYTRLLRLLFSVEKSSC
ncbi:MAG: hypothetical protein O7F12_03825, partial [Nitrospirae bacterium]|nr:hypothetical protein [Nitrospirota bacterium]